MSPSINRDRRHNRLGNMVTSVEEEIWEEEKLKAWHRMWEDLEIGYLDTDILDVLIEFFERPESYPKSSCSGRIVALDAEHPWVKDETTIVFKKHEPISLDELQFLLKRRIAHILWLIVQGPIYHIYTKSLDDAWHLLEMAREAGFKHSGILAINEKGVLVELRTGIKLVIPLKKDEKIMISELHGLVEIVNNVLAAAKNRNNRLLDVLRRHKPRKRWNASQSESVF